MAKRRTNEEILSQGGLDPYQEDWLNAELDRLAKRSGTGLPAAGTGADVNPPSSPLRDKLSRALWRANEIGGDITRGFATLPLKAMKAPAYIQEKVFGDATPVNKKIRDWATAAEDWINEKTDYSGEQAGGRNPYKIVPEIVGGMVLPGPQLPAIRKLFSKEGMKLAGKGMALMAPYGAATNVIQQLDQPVPKLEDVITGNYKGPKDFDWGSLLRDTALTAGLAPVFQRFSGYLENRAARKQAQAQASGVQMPNFGGAKGAPSTQPRPPKGQIPPPPPAGLPGPAPNMRRIPPPADYIDAEFRPLTKDELSPNKLPPGQMPPEIFTPERKLLDTRLKPQPTGPGTVIESPGPVYTKPPKVEDIVAKQRFRKVEPMASPEAPTLPDKLELPKEIDVSLAKGRPAITKKGEPPLLRNIEPEAAPPVAAPQVKETDVYGPSLAQFLRSKGGVLDQGGEIGRLEMGRKPFEKGLLKADGMDLDTAAELAAEAGYLPRRDVNLLLEALDSESRGKPAYAPGRANAGLENDLFEQRFTAEKPYVDPYDAELALAPEEPVHPSDLPQELLPPLESDFPDIPNGFANPFVDDLAGAATQKKTVSRPDDPFNLEVQEVPTPKVTNSPADSLQTALDLPPPVVGQKPLIGREVTPEEAPLFSKAAQQPVQEQTTLPIGEKAPLSQKNPQVTAPVQGKATQFHEVDPVSAKEVGQEFHVEREGLGKVWDTLNNERGSVQLGKGVTLVERGLSQRRMAERHPEFQPIYQTSIQRAEFASTVKTDLRKLAEPYFLLDDADRVVVDKYLRSRRGQQSITNLVDRETGAPLPPLTPVQRSAVKAIDQSMASAFDLINDVRATRGLPPMQPDAFYVPFSRSGDYLTIMDGPNNQKWVSASNTLREAEALEKQLQAKYPGAHTMVRSASGKKGDQPALDFGTLALLEKAGLLSPDEYEQAIKQFNLPPGFSEHFRHAMKVMGEATDLTSPIERYIDAMGNYTAKFLHDDVMKEQITKLKDPAMRQYAERYREYLNEKPQEWATARGAVAVWDLMLNVGSMVQNASQVPVLGVPNLQRAVGPKKAVGIFKDAWKSVLKPNAQQQAILEMAEREGHIRPINAQELFGTSTVEPNTLELGSPYVQRLVDRGMLSQATASAIRKPLDTVASAFSKAGDVFSAANQSAGQKLSYALHRLTGNSVQVSEDAARRANPFLMQGFSAIEELNRKWSILAGYDAGIAKGMSHAEAYEFAKAFSRDVNFDYSAVSRPELFRGRKAIVGLFGTYPIEALSTYSKFFREAVKGKPGPFVTAMAAFGTMAGIKGIPFVEDIDTYGPKPGVLSENIPEWMYHGPASALTGLDLASKYKMRIPVISDIPNVASGEFDLSTMPVAQPFVSAKKTADWFLNSPMDAPSIQVGAERLLPPALRSLAASARWAGFGPAGEIERGSVGTIKGHTPGPNAEGRKDFFHPSAKDILGKALTFTPLELSQQYQRGKVAAVQFQRDKADTGKLIQAVANELDRNGTATQTESMRQLQAEHPKTYRELIKAHNRRQASGSGSTLEFYRAKQEPKPKKAVNQ